MVDFAYETFFDRSVFPFYVPWQLNFVSHCLDYASWSSLVTSAVTSRSHNDKLKGASGTTDVLG